MIGLDALQARVAPDYAAMLARLAHVLPGAAAGDEDETVPPEAVAGREGAAVGTGLSGAVLSREADRPTRTPSDELHTGALAMLRSRPAPELPRSTVDAAPSVEPVRFRLWQHRPDQSQSFGEQARLVTGRLRFDLGKLAAGEGRADADADADAIASRKPASAEPARPNPARPARVADGKLPPAPLLPAVEAGRSLRGAAAVPPTPVRMRGTLPAPPDMPPLRVPWAAPDLMQPAAWTRDESVAPDPLADEALEDGLASLLERAASDAGVDVWR